MTSGLIPIKIVGKEVDIMREYYPNVIIGGGPAGLNMALEFSKRGIKYLLLEASETVGGQWDRHPVCG